jgi:hypothetical protein
MENMMENGPEIAKFRKIESVAKDRKPRKRFQNGERYVTEKML